MADLLFLPAPEHRGALLDDGVGGARVPTWTICTCERHGQQVQTDGLHPWFCPVCCTDPIDGTTIKGRETALILIWRGQVAQEGCDRLARVLNAHGSRWSFDLRCDYGGSVDGHSMGLAALAERAGLGTVVRVGGDRV